MERIVRRAVAVATADKMCRIQFHTSITSQVQNNNCKPDSFLIWLRVSAIGAVCALR
jgi:hypothetical protein